MTWTCALHPGSRCATRNSKSLPFEKYFLKDRPINGGYEWFGDKMSVCVQNSMTALIQVNECWAKYTYYGTGSMIFEAAHSFDSTPSLLGKIR